MNGNTVVRIGIGLLFVWGGLEKFIPGFFGGVGLDAMSEFLKQSGLSFLGGGTYVVGALLAVAELVAGILILANKRLFEAYLAVAFFMFMALILVWLPAVFNSESILASSGWMNVIIHITLMLVPLGLALEAKEIANKQSELA